MPYKDPDVRREKGRETMRRWRANNRDRAKAQGRKHKQAMRDRGYLQMRGKLIDLDPKYVIALKSDPCSYCGKLPIPAKGTIDHIIPVDENGPDEWENFAGACASCNKRKWGKSLLLYLAHRNGCWEFRCDLEPVVPASA